MNAVDRDWQQPLHLGDLQHRITEFVVKR